MEVILTILVLIISVPLGGLFVAIMDRKSNDQVIKLMLAFSGGFLLSLAFIHFIPELYEHSHAKVGIYILVGFLIQLVLEFFSGGIEHGHIHTSKEGKFPMVLVLALGAHAFLEGIPLGTELAGVEIATSHQHGNESGLLMGILLHRFPVAIALATILFTSSISKKKVWFTLGIFALTTPFGLLLGMSSSAYFYNHYL